jgi:hypothetical protein
MVDMQLGMDATMPASAQAQLEIFPYRIDDMPQMLELAQMSLGSTIATPMTPAFWMWKHHAGVFGESYGIYAMDEQRSTVAGMRVLMRWQFALDKDRQLVAARAVDTATHPNYKRQGIFSTLTRQAISDLAREGVHTIYNTPNRQSLPGYLKMGWHVVATLPLYIKILRPWRMLLRQLRKGDEISSLSFANFFEPLIMKWHDFSRHYGEQLPALISKWEAERPRYGLRTVRSLDYLEWRYGQHPAIQYGVYAEAESNGQLKSFVILRPNTRYGCQEVVITDLFLAESSARSAAILLSNLARQVNGDYLIAHFGDKTLEKHALRRSGFLPVPRRGIVFTVRPLQEGLDDLFLPGSWDLSLGDLEVF